jgi:hypothetical protein
MILKHFYITLALFCISSSVVYSQTNCETPLPPVFTLVSIEPETGVTEFTWTLSSSTDVAAYLIYTYHDENGIPRGDIIDTIWNPAATSYNYSSTGYKYFSSSFVVAAYRLPGSPEISRKFGCASPFSNILNTIHTEASVDTCNKKIMVSWNSYLTTLNKVTGYSVLVSVNGSTYTEISNSDAATNNFGLNDFLSDAEYCFVIRADIEGGLSSTSNKACISTKMQRPPVWINSDQATVNSDNNIALSFTIDPLSEINHFRLEKKIGPAGEYQETALLTSSNGTIKYIDNKADITQINYYRILALNNCNIPVTISNTASNIVLSLERSGNDLNFRWNPYRQWLGEISSYRLFINTGKGFEESRLIDPADTTITMAYQDIMYEITGGNICFYISTTEESNPYGITGQSLSSSVCIPSTEVITVPNLFLPNNGTKNAYFRPILSFTPTDYRLVITDKVGNILFETKDYLKDWDGSGTGNSQQDAVCLWFLKVTTPSGKNISKTGTVTVINSRK